jgi:hypothetical protein
VKCRAPETRVRNITPVFITKHSPPVQGNAYSPPRFVSPRGTPIGEVRPSPRPPPGGKRNFTPAPPPPRSTPRTPSVSDFVGYPPKATQTSLLPKGVILPSQAIDSFAHRIRERLKQAEEALYRMEMDQRICRTAIASCRGEMDRQLP